MFNCGMVDYINTIPLIAPFKFDIMKPPFQFVMAPPSDLNRFMKEEKLPISMMSSMFYLQNKNRFELVNGIGIGAPNKVLSVSLFYPEGLKSFDGIEVALDPESATSNAIVKWLLTDVKKYKPQFIQPKKASDGPLYSAFVLIGDRCLGFKKPAGYAVMDIGEEWLKETSFPLPFAVIAADKNWAEKNNEHMSVVKESFVSAVVWSRGHLHELYKLARLQTTLNEASILDYWNHLEYVFDYRYTEALNYMESHLINKKESVV